MDNEVLSHYTQVTKVATFRLSGLKEAVKEVEGFNAKLAVLITSAVGTMACAYLFAALALVSLPEVLITAKIIPPDSVPHFLANQGLILLVAWVAQTFLQLVLLSIIIVGQRVQSRSTEARSEKTFEDTERLLDLMNIETEGGLQIILNEIRSLKA